MGTRSSGVYPEFYFFCHLLELPLLDLLKVSFFRLKLRYTIGDSIVSHDEGQVVQCRLGRIPLKEIMFLLSHGTKLPPKQSAIVFHKIMLSSTDTGEDVEKLINARIEG